MKSYWWFLVLTSLLLATLACGGGKDPLANLSYEIGDQVVATGAGYTDLEGTTPGAHGGTTIGQIAADPGGHWHDENFTRFRVEFPNGEAYWFDAGYLSPVDEP